VIAVGGRGRVSTWLGAVMVCAVAFGVIAQALPAEALTSVIIQEFPTTTANSQPDGITLGPDGNLWFAESAPGANRVGRINAGGSVTEFPLPAGFTAPGEIATGSDGGLWFTEAEGIGRIDPSAPNTITEFPLSTGDEPNSITAGPDGNLWFTDQGTNSVGRILAASPNTVTEFAIPITGPSGPAAITVGRDQKLWFTDAAAHKVVRFDPKSDKFAKFGTGMDSQPVDITAGSDGNLWFVDVAFDLVERMDISGTVSGTFSFPGTGPFTIGSGPDGDIWFYELQSNDLISLDTSGNVVSITTVPTESAVVSGFAAGPDGNLWFTESGPSQIGRAMLPHLNSSVIAYIPNRFFVPNVDLVGNVGDTVSWLMLNPAAHVIHDTSGMGLFGSAGRVPIGQLFAFRFIAAGTYAYGDAQAARGLRPGRGQIRVPIVAQLVPGTTNQAQVVWASADPPSGFVFDVQVAQPGGGFVDWRTGVTGSNGVFGPSDPLYVGPGTYRFRARIRNTANGAACGWSAPGSVALG
jgi:virginiamycin B lyase